MQGRKVQLVGDLREIHIRFRDQPFGFLDLQTVVVGEDRLPRMSLEGLGQMGLAEVEFADQFV